MPHKRPKRKRKQQYKIKYYPSGQIEWISFRRNKQTHNEDEPSYMRYYPDGNVKIKRWIVNKKLHRTTGYAYIMYYNTGKIKEKYWFINGSQYRSNKPFIIKNHENGNIHVRLHINYQHDHRGFVYYEDRKLKKQAWLRHKQFHREDGPAHILYRRDGSVFEKLFAINGTRIDGFTYCSNFLKKKANEYFNEINLIDIISEYAF